MLIDVLNNLEKMKIYWRTLGILWIPTTFHRVTIDCQFYRGCCSARETYRYRQNITVVLLLRTCNFKLTALRDKSRRHLLFSAPSNSGVHKSHSYLACIGSLLSDTICTDSVRTNNYIARLWLNYIQLLSRRLACARPFSTTRPLNNLNCIATTV